MTSLSDTGGLSSTVHENDQMQFKHTQLDNITRTVLAPQQVTNDLKVFMPVLWSLDNYNSCNRLVCPSSVLHLWVLFVRQGVRMASCKLRDKSYIFEAIACITMRSSGSA